METAKSDGQSPGQAEGDSSAEKGGAGDAPDWKSRYENLEARFDLLNDSFSELRQAIVDSRRPGQAASAQVPEPDDDEPLTASKVNRIVQSNLTKVVAQNNQLSQRQVWDDKAKSEFPLSDPKFLREFKREWREQVEGGLDPNHPRAIYNVAKITARAVGVKKERPAKDSDAETTHTSEAPTGASAQRPAARERSGKAVSDDDPRLAFYKMKGDRTPQQIEAMKKRLGEKDASRRAGK